MYTENPDDRYQSTEELMYALQHYHDYETQMQRRYHRRMGIFFSGFINSANVCSRRLGNAHKGKGAAER